MMKNNSIISTQRKELTEHTEDKQLVEYLILVRYQLENDTKLKDIVVNSNPAIEAKGTVIQHLLAYIKPDTETLFRKAVEQILSELDDIRTKKPSLYLVDQSTGNLLMPVDNNSIFTPPDYVGEDGKIHKSNPIVHPGVSSSLAMAMHKHAKINKAIAKSKKNPATKQAYTHLVDPDKIIEFTKEKLQTAGVEISTSISVEESHTIEFGREQITGVFQSSNLYFHRIQIFSSTLAHKILKLKFKKCEFGKLESKHNSKQQWYVIEVKLSN